MMRLLLKKYVNESIWLWLACGLMLYLFCWARVWIVCQFDLQQFQPFLEQFRSFEKFSPVPLEQLLTYTGSIGMTFHEPVLILCILVWCIARGSDVVSGELGRGTLEILLAQPISRMRLLSSHALVSTLGLALLCLIAWLGLTCGILSNSITEQIVPVTEVKIPFWPATIPIASGPAVPVTTPLVQRVNPWVYAAPTLNLFALGFFMLSLSVLFSCFDRYRWRTIGLVVGLYVVQLLLFILSKSTEATAACGYGTILSAYQPDAIIQFSRDNLQQAWWLSVPVDRRTASWQFALGPLGLSSLLLALAVLCYAGAAYRFHRRDLPAPL